jgi:hypothetical protein
MNKYPRYFTLQELLTSSTARQKSIENLPSFEIVQHLLELGYFLDMLREDWGGGITVTSGFRNEKLNSAVGGVANSVHKIGYAVDIYPANGKFEAFKRFVVDWLKDKKFDELILESNKKTGAKWLHLQLYSNSGEQRRKVFSLAV